MEQIKAQKAELQPNEAIVADCLTRMMQVEDERSPTETYLEGWHYLFNQPEFVHTDRVQSLMELAERRSLLETVAQRDLPEKGARVVIGKENQSEAVQNYSFILSRYGLPGEATGTIGLVGPTRMQYARNMAAVNHLSLVLSELIGELYGRRVIG